MEQARPGAMRRESTAEMTRHLCKEVGELRAALAACRGDRVAEPRVTAAAMAHLLLSSRALLQNLLIDTARLPRPLPIPGARPEALTPPRPLPH